MKNGDVRGACIALIRNRVGATGPARPPRPAALGLRLERSDLPPGELAALCAAALGALGSPGVAVDPPRRWEPSDALRALLGEYRRVRGRGAPVRQFAS